MPWVPGDPWPTDTPGGAYRAEWGGYAKVWLLAEIAPGRLWRIGPDPDDRLDAGNVLGDAGSLFGTPSLPGTLPVTSGLWVDLSCDVIDIEIRGGAPTVAGVRSRTDAGTLTVTLYDPTGRYDPLNPDTPFALGGRSRLLAGVRVLCFAEIVHDPATSTVFTWNLFTGTADAWTEPWTKDPGSRRCTLVASDVVKQLNRMERPEQTPVGAGETVFARLNRVAFYFGFSLNAFGELTDRTLAATTLTGTAWEQLNAAAADDLGFLYVNGNGGLIYQSYKQWQYLGAGPVDLTVGCDDPGAFDIVTDARPAALDAFQLNKVTAARAGGVDVTASNDHSIAVYGERSVREAQLGLADDTQAGGWAADLVAVSAFPRHAVDQIVMVPAVDPEPWRALERTLGLTPVSSIVRLLFRTDRFDYTIDVRARMVGWTYRLTASRWSVEWRTVSANMASGANPWRLGPDAFDRLDAGNVLT